MMCISKRQSCRRGGHGLGADHGARGVPRPGDQDTERAVPRRRGHREGVDVPRDAAPSPVPRVGATRCGNVRRQGRGRVHGPLPAVRGVDARCLKRGWCGKFRSLCRLTAFFGVGHLQCVDGLGWLISCITLSGTAYPIFHLNAPAANGLVLSTSRWSWHTQLQWWSAC